MATTAKHSQLITIHDRHRKSSGSTVSMSSNSSTTTTRSSLSLSSASYWQDQTLGNSQHTKPLVIDFEQLELRQRQNKQIELPARCIDSRLALQQNPCDSLTVNNQTIDFRLRWVCKCLTHLLQDELNADPRHHHQQCNSLYATAKQHSFQCKFDAERERLKKMTEIYSILLKRPTPICALHPLMLHKPHEKTFQSLLDARQQVLRLIERLEGYCDSIGALRCILKSSHMIGVLYTFDEVMKKMYYLATPKPLKSLDGACEFRVLKEWRL